MVHYDEISPSGQIVRVRYVDPDRRKIYVEYRNGTIVTVSNLNPFSFEVGSVLIINSNTDYIEEVPKDLWPEQSWVGIVHLISDEKTIIDTRGGWRILPTKKELDYKVGYTIEGKDSEGIIGILSETPLEYLNPPIDESAINMFKLPKGGDEAKEEFSDFGGYSKVIDRARDLIELPIKFKKKFNAMGTKPIKGVLFTGPPGTGKTMLARIIANETDSVFYQISGPEVMSKWYGASEKILRKLFEDAAEQDQAIIFFDEIDSIASQRGDHSHEASKRIVAQLLTLMDGFKPENNVMVIAATNRLQDIDKAFRRPGRFDGEIHFHMPTLEDRIDILKVTGKKTPKTKNLPYLEMAKKTEGWSSADLAAIWKAAVLLAIKDNREIIMPEDFVGGFKRHEVQKQQAEKELVDGEA